MISNDRSASKQADKKPYVRPQLVKHGSVETLTQLNGNGTSLPPIHT